MILQKKIQHRHQEQKLEAVTPEEDWINEWASNAGKFSKDSMQKLWGAILAGKMYNPDGYSFQTMDIIRKMSDADANLFVKLCSIQISKSVLTRFELWENFLSWSEIFQLTDLGLIDSNSVTTQVHVDSKDCSVRNLNSAKLITFGGITNSLVFIYSTEVDDMLRHQGCFRLTKPGIDLLDLISQMDDSIQTNIDYLKELGTALRIEIGIDKCGFAITDRELSVIFTEGLEINSQTGETSIIP